MKPTRQITASIVLVLFLAVPGIAQNFTKVDSGAAVKDYKGSRDNAFGVTWMDYNNDGHMDLFFAVTSNQKDMLLKNNGDGSFKRISVAPFNTRNKTLSTSWADYNNDGNIDCYMAIQSRWYDSDGDGTKDMKDKTNFLVQNQGNGNFKVMEQSTAMDGNFVAVNASWADYDNNGFLDLYVTNYKGNNELFYNQDRGGFVDLSNTPLVAAGDNSFFGSWVDVNNDNNMDMMTLSTAGGKGAKKLFINNEQRGFQQAKKPFPRDNLKASQRFSGVSFGDYDNDGDLDFYRTNRNDGNALMKNDGSGNFNKQHGSSTITYDRFSTGSSWGDIDNDGDLDLYVANKGQGNRLYINNGNGSFTLAQNSPTMGDTADSHGTAFADFNNDGFLDLAVANYGGPNFLFKNQGNDNNYIKIRLVGTETNRSAIGTKIKVTADLNGDGSTTTQYRQIQTNTGGGTGSQNSLIAHFGLKNASKINSINVNWPGGKGFNKNNTQTFTDLDVNQTIKIEENNNSISRIHNDKDQQKQEIFSDIKVYPNPFTKQFNINGEALKDAKNVHAKLFNSMGQQVPVQKREMQDGHYRFNVRKDLNPGIYILKVTTESNTYTKQINHQ